MVNISDIKLPPHNIDAEKSILCAILLDNENMYILDTYKMQPHDFYQKEHQFIFDGMLSLRARKGNIDVITLTDAISKQWNLEIIWWQDYIYDLSIFTLATNMVDEYSKIVKEKSVLRQIIKVSQSIITECYSQWETTQIIEHIEKKIFELTQFDFQDGLIHIKDLLNNRIEDYMNIAEDPESINIGKIISDYDRLDNYTWWFKPWELVILAARPSMGKTAFSLNLLANAAIKHKKSVAFFSLEMTSESIVDRLTAMVSGVNMTKIIKWQLEDNDFAMIWEASSVLSETNIYIDDSGITMPWLRSKLRKLKIEKWLDFVIIDYLQLINSSWTRYAGNKVQEVSEMSRAMKELAKELKVPIVCLSQLSRETEKRPDKRPILSDLRDSWSIEQDADMVIFLYRDEYYDPDTDRKWVTDVLLRKNRNGEVWDVELRFEWPIMKFTSV